LLHAVAGKFADDATLSRLQCLHVYLGLRDPESEHTGVTGTVQYVGAVQERLGRHAAAKDAETAQFGAGVDDGHFLAETSSHAGCVEPGGSAADGDEIK
jgi:hypothetical protein